MYIFFFSSLKRGEQNMIICAVCFSECSVCLPVVSVQPVMYIFSYIHCAYVCSACLAFYSFNLAAQRK